METVNMTNELYTTLMSLGVIVMASLYWLSVLASERFRLSWQGRVLNILGAVICVALAIVAIHWRG